MGIYIFIYLLLLLGLRIKKKNLYCSIILLIFMGIRYNVGADFLTYYNLAEKHEYLSLSLLKKNINLSSNYTYIFYQYYRFEIFNKILYKIVWFFKYPQLIIFLYSFLTLFFIKKGLDLKKINTVKSWLIFYSMPIFFLNFLSIMRQGVAIAICFYSYKYIKNKNIIYFMCWILVASLFHKTALIFGGAYLLQFINLNNYKGILICIFSFFGENIFMKILSLYSKYNHYLNKDYYIKSGTKFLYIIIFMCILIIYTSLKDKKRYNDYKIEINITIVGCYIYVLLKNQGLTGIRLSSYYLIYFLYVLNELKYIKIYKNKININKYIYLFCFLLLVISLQVDKNKNNYNKTPQYIPYKTIITK